MTVITINLSLGVLLMVLLPFLTSRYCLEHLNTDCLVAFCMAVMIRAVFPVEFSFSTTIPVARVIPAVRDIMICPVNISGHEIYLCYVLFFLSMSIAVFLIFRKLYLSYQMQKLIRRMPDCEDQSVREVWETIQAKYPAAAHVRIVKTTLKISPQIVGIRQPVILLPEYSFTRFEYRMILEHEMLHCLRHDILLKTVIDSLCTFYWWNPVFYFLKKRCFDLIEIGNDTRMTRLFSANEKAAYMQCLTDTVKKIQEPPIPLALPIGRSDQRTLHKRMYLIGHSRMTGRIRQMAAFLFLLLFLGFGTSFTLEPYNPPGEPYIVLNETNCFLIQDGECYEVYYEGALLYTTDSIDYFSKDIPVYIK